MGKLEAERLEVEKIFCPACDKFERHIQKPSGEWECLECWLREMSLEKRFPDLFKDKEVI